MDTTELLEILNGIFRKVLKRDDITCLLYTSDAADEL